MNKYWVIFFTILVILILLVTAVYLIDNMTHRTNNINLINVGMDAKEKQGLIDSMTNSASGTLIDQRSKIIQNTSGNSVTSINDKDRVDLLNSMSALINN